MEAGILIYMSCQDATTEEQVKALLEAGIKRTFLSASHPMLDDTLKLVRENGMICETLHGVFNEPDGIAMNDTAMPGEAGDIMIDRLCENILTCSKYNVPILIVHIPRITELYPCIDKRFKKLGDFARENNVTLAFENCGHSYKGLKHILTIIPDAKFCYDNAHHILFDSETDYIKSFGDILTALHITDNDKINDGHLIPFDGETDLESVARGIAASGFNGTLMLESMYKKEYAEKMTYSEFALRVKASADKMIRMIEKFRSI